MEQFLKINFYTISVTIISTKESLNGNLEAVHCTRSILHPTVETSMFDFVLSTALESLSPHNTYAYGKASVA